MLYVPYSSFTSLLTRVLPVLPAQSLTDGHLSVDRGWRVVTRGPGLYLTTAWCVQRIPDLQQGSQRSSHEGEPVQGAQEGELIICLKKEHALQQGSGWEPCFFSVSTTCRTTPWPPGGEHKGPCLVVATLAPFGIKPTRRNVQRKLFRSGNGCVSDVKSTEKNL